MNAWFPTLLVSSESAQSANNAQISTLKYHPGLKNMQHQFVVSVNCKHTFTKWVIHTRLQQTVVPSAIQYHTIRGILSRRGGRGKASITSSYGEVPSCVEEKW